MITINRKVAMAKNQDDYQEGYNDACEHFQKTHISLEEVAGSFDKFLDKINKMKKIHIGIYNHFKKNLGLNGTEIKTLKEKRVNIKEIIKLIEIDMLAEQKS